MEFLPQLILFIFGAIIGSFLNVVIIRLHTGATLVGRSGCLSCGATLTPAQLIPIVSFLALRKRCARCGSKISWQYIIVELLTAILFVCAWYAAITPLELFFALVFISLLLVIAVYDFHHTIIPTVPLYGFIFAAILFRIFGVMRVDSLTSVLITAVLGAVIVAAPLFLMWLFSRGAWMGWGDVKLASGIGIALGVQGGLQALLCAFFSGAIVGVVLIALSKYLHTKHVTLKSEIPFAPFLVFGFLVMFLCEVDIITLVL